jgi:hypothetical protein
MIGDGRVFIRVTNAVRFQGFRNFVPKDVFTRYCWLTIDPLVKRDHGPPARCAASFHATRWTLCDVVVASEGRLGP